MRGKHPAHLGASLRHLHRWAGALSALFLFWMAGTGLLIGSEDNFALNQVRVSWSWLMRWYGVPPSPAVTHGFPFNDHWLIVGAEHNLLDENIIAKDLHDIHGAVFANNLIYVAADEGLELLTADGQLVETLTAPTLPVTGVDRIGVDGAQLVIQRDTELFSSDDGEVWSKRDAATSVNWSQTAALPSALQLKANALAGVSMPLGRILADMHSGRFFGRVGVYIVNAVGVATLLLSVSGLWLYWRTRSRGRKGR